MRNARIVHDHAKTAKLVPDALRRGGDGVLIRDVELEGAGIQSDGLRCRLPTLEVACPDEHGEAVRREVLCDLKADSLVCAGDQSDRLVVHNNLLLTSRGN